MRNWGGSNLDANSLQSGSVLDAIQQLITDSVWQAIYKQSQEQKQLDAQKAKSVSAAPKQAKPFKPKIVSPQASKTKKTSAQEIQRQKVQANAVKSKPKTTSVPSSSATCLTSTILAARRQLF